MKRLLLSVAACAALTSAHDVITTQITYSREISRLIYSRCARCHHEGGRAFSLTSYTAARPWAKAIKEEVLERRMPPWGAVKGFAEFRDDQSLTQEQIELIADWVEGGAPEGDAKYLPKLPEFSAGARPATPPGVPVHQGSTLKTAATVFGVRADGVGQGAALMAVAERPDGSVEPLLWLYQYTPGFAHPYWYNSPVRLPAGSKITISPADAGGVVLLTQRER